MSCRDLVSIILPIYNKRQYLYRCLNSIGKQTYKYIEVIMVDDGSTDGGCEICKEFEKKDNRYIYLSQCNKGVSAARNSGICRATGKWLAFIDPDDYVLPEYIEKLLNCVRDETDIVACGCCVELDGKRVNNSFWKTDRVFTSYKEKKDLYFQLMDSSYGTPAQHYTAIGVPWGKIYRKQFILNNKLEFDVELKRMQDNIFNMYAFFYAQRIFYLNKGLYVYNVENVKSYNNVFDKKCIYCYTKLLDLRDSFFKEHYMNEFSDFEKYLNREIFCILEIMMSKYFFNIYNSNTIRKKVYEFNNFIEKHNFNLTIDKLDINDFSNLKEKIILHCLKKNNITMLLICSDLYFRLKEKINKRKWI